jgi:DNA-3-methyladenine glycosylase
MLPNNQPLLLRPLRRAFYNRDTILVARELLGKRLVRETDEGIVYGRIVEAEAYLGQTDSASHSYRGPTRRNAAMFGPPGHAYIYAIHSRWCFNVVTEPAGVAHAVLIRAVEPEFGQELMAARRGPCKPRDLARGPARLCEAFALDRSLDHHDLERGQELWISPGDREIPPEEIAVTPRIGVTSAKDKLLRFAIKGNPYVSGRRV